MGLDVGRHTGPDDNRDVFSGTLGFGTAETHNNALRAVSVIKTFGTDWAVN